MELWIRSQTKTKLKKIDNLEIKSFEEGYGIVEWLDSNNFYGLGIYKTKERALEVLDEIQKILKPQLIIKNSGKIIGSFEGTIIREGATCEIKELTTYVYEIPEE